MPRDIKKICVLSLEIRVNNLLVIPRKRFGQLSACPLKNTRSPTEVQPRLLLTLKYVNIFLLTREIVINSDR